MALWLPATRPNNSFKPNLLRYTKAMAEKACHGFGSTTQVGLTQALYRRDGAALLKNEYWFTSTQFHLQEGEEDSTNPGCFGKSLAEWLATELKAIGYTTEVIAEDWGWCVMCVRGEYLLWVGCGNVLSDAILASTLDSPPKEHEIVWHVFTELEVPFFMVKSNLKKLFGLLDIKAPLAKLRSDVDKILSCNELLSFCDEP